MAEFNRTSLLVQKKAVYEKKYYVAENRALSSLAWASTLSWPIPTPSWQCQSLPSAALSACIKKSNLSVGHYIIVRGQFSNIKRYYLATYNDDGQLNIEKGHWLDYCPDKRNVGCD